MFSLNLKKRKIFAVLIVCMFLIHTTEAGHTSEEIDEESKLLYRAESSILASTENNKHQYKHTYYDSPCTSGGCPGAFSPCSNPAGCPQTAGGAAINNGIGHSVNSGASLVPGTNGGFGAGFAVNSGHDNVSPSLQIPFTGGSGFAPPVTYQVPHGAGFAVNTGQSNVLPSPQITYNGGLGYAPPLPYQIPNGVSYGAVNNFHSGTVNGAHPKPPSPQTLQNAFTGYIQPAVPAPYPHWQSHPSHYGYQGPRGYSVYDHALKLNTEYTEVGTHKGPLQRSNNGYGSGYDGGYNGLFNRPGF